MSTTNELPPPDTSQKLDTLIDLVTSFRADLLAEMQTIKDDARERYVDLRQRIERVDERLTRLEAAFEQQQRQLAFVAERMEHLDIKFDVFVKEFSFLKDRVREVEATRELRH